MTNRQGNAGADRMASRGAVRQARGSGGEYLRKGAQVYIEGQLRTRSGRITVSPVTSPKFLLRPRAHADAGTCRRCSDSAGRGATVSGQPQPEPQAEAGTKKGGAKRKAVDVRPRSRSLSRNRRRGRLRVFRRYPVLIGLTVITARPVLCGASPER